MRSLALSLSIPQEKGKKVQSLLVFSNNYVSPIGGKVLMDRLPRFAMKKNDDCGKPSEDTLRKV